MAEIGRKILKFQVFTWLYRSLMADRERWLLWMPVLLGCGIGIYFALPFEPPLWVGWSGFAVFTSLAWAVRAKSNGQAMALMAVAFVGLGVGVAGVRTWTVAAPVIQKELKAVTVEGQVLRVEGRPKGMRITLGGLRIGHLTPDMTPGRVRVTLSAKQPAFGPGDWLKLRASLSPPSPPAEPGAFDFQRQSYFRGLGGVGFSYGQAEVTGRAPKRGFASLRFVVERWRSAIAERVRAGLSGEAGAVAAALMTGDRGAISERVLDNMRASGLAHLLAISGLHVGLIAGIVFFIVRAGLALIHPLALKYPIKKWAACAAIVGAGGYALLAGATVPTQRAFLMIGLVFLAVLFDRRALSMRSVAGAALVILMVAPESLTGASFQLSFAAVVALIAVYEALRQAKWFHGSSQSFFAGAWRYVLGVAVTTLVAGLATAVFAAFHFNRVADFSLAANVVAVPVTALWIMPWAVVSYVLMPFGLEGLTLIPMGWGVDVVLGVADEVAHWPGAVSTLAAFPIWGLALVSLGGLWLAIWRERWRSLGVPIMMLGVSSMLWSTSADVLIDSTGKLVAVKTPQGGYTVSTLRSKRFERDVWMRRAGLIEAQGKWLQTGLNGVSTDMDFVEKTTQEQSQGAYLGCDAQGCILTKNGHSVAFAKSPDVMVEDCVNARVLVSLSDFGDTKVPCTATQVIRFGDLHKNGAHALYFTKLGVRVETVRAQRGQRPWVIE